MADDEVPARALLVQNTFRGTFAFPDALMAVLLALVASLEWQRVFVPIVLVQSRDEWLFALIAEGAFLMAQGTLIDVATRLRKRPPIWAIPLIVAAIVVFFDEARAIIQIAWQRGAVVIVPLALSLLQRGMVLWHMPDRPKIEKIAARALIANRITTGLAAFGAVTIAMILGVVFHQQFEMVTGAWWPAFLAGSIYYAIGAFDSWRVRQPRFAERPTVLFRYDSIGIDYLEPV